jgi:hypothetical protein
VDGRVKPGHDELTVTNEKPHPVGEIPGGAFMSGRSLLASFPLAFAAPGHFVQALAL